MYVCMYVRLQHDVACYIDSETEKCDDRTTLNAMLREMRQSYRKRSGAINMRTIAQTLQPEPEVVNPHPIPEAPVDSTLPALPVL